MKLTSKLLKQIIEEEASKFGKMQDPKKKAKDTEETDADELAGTLEKKIDYAKALKVEEGRLRRRLNKISEVRSRVLRSIAKSV